MFQLGPYEFTEQDIDTTLAAGWALLPAEVAPEVSFRVRLTWGIGSLGTITYLNIVTALVLVYLTTVMHIPAGLAGVIVSAARIIDAFSDPQQAVEDFIRGDIER